MKTNFTFLLFITLLLAGSGFAQNMGVNNPSPHPKALLDLTDTTRGILIPRMTEAQRTAMFAVPDATANGMMVYQTDNASGFYFYDGISWNSVNNNANQWALSGNTGTTAANYIGTADSTPIYIKTNGQERLRVSANGKVSVGGALNTSWLTLPDSLGEKLTLYTGGTGYNYGFGIQPSLLQIHSSSSGSAIAMGWGTSNDFHENMRLTGSGKMILGNPAVPYTGYSAGLAILDTTGFNNGIYIQSNVNESDIFLAKSHGTGLSQTPVVAGDQLGGVWGLGYEGTYQSVSAAITFLVDSTPSSNFVPGMICFGTSSAPGNYVSGKDYINRHGYLGILQYPSYPLDVNGDINVTAGNSYRINGVVELSSGTYYNIGTGAYTGRTDTNFYNSYYGYASGYNTSGGADNTFLGSEAGFYNSTGNDNTALGFNALSTNSTGFGNTALGSNANTFSSNLNYATAIGYNAIAGASNTLVLGGTGSYAVNVGIGMTTPNTALDVLGGLTLRDNGTTTSITSDNQTVTVGNRTYLRLSSNLSTATSRTVTLSDGLQRGQLLIIESVSTSTNAFEIADNIATNNTDVPSAVTMTGGDIITMLWNGANWLEVSFSNND